MAAVDVGKAILALLAIVPHPLSSASELSRTNLHAGNFCGTSAGCIYPLPRNATQSSPRGTPPTLNPHNLRVKCQPAGNPACTSTVLPAVERIKSRIFPVKNGVQISPSSLITDLVIKMSSTEIVPLQHGVNESYELTVPSASNSMSIIITAANEWGALYGLESFGQSVSLFKGTDHNFFPTAQPFYGLTLWPPARIVDSPRTSWRGLM